MRRHSVIKTKAMGRERKGSEEKDDGREEVKKKKMKGKRRKR